jgi:acyl dehydratase
MPVATLDEIASRVGTDLGASEWILIDQASIDAFAEVTGDRQFIHVDPEAARQTPFGGTIAHGFFTLSLLSRMAAGVMLVPDTTRMVVNYGFEKVRFLAPVPAGSRVRGHFRLARAEEKRPGQWQFLHEAKVEIEGSERPALQADWLSLIFV